MIDPYYQDDYATIYHGDCREILPDLQKVDLVLTDPPYGAGFNGMKQISVDNAAKCGDYIWGEWNNLPVDDETMRAIISQSRMAIVFGGNYYSLPPSKCWLIWDKDNTGNFADAELAWTNLPQVVRLKKYRWNGMLQEPNQERNCREHPTQKPIQVMKWCVSQADKHCGGKAKTILDPYMGSGSTLRAAKDLQRKAIGIEIEEKYCEIAARRLAQEVLALS